MLKECSHEVAKLFDTLMLKVAGMGWLLMMHDVIESVCSALIKTLPCVGLVDQ